MMGPTDYGSLDIDRKWKVCEQLHIVACVNDTKERPREWPIVDLSNHELLKRSTHGPERGLIAVVRRRHVDKVQRCLKVQKFMHAPTSFGSPSPSRFA